MNEKTALMKKEIRLVSAYRSLILSKYYMTVCLVFSSYYVGYIGYAMSPLYILLLLNTLPPLLAYMLKDYNSKHPGKLFLHFVTDSSFLLTGIKKKYRYTRLSATANSLVVYFTLVLLILWQINYHSIPNISRFSLLLPSIIIIGAVLIRLLGSIIYQIKLPYDLSHNKV